MPEHDVILFDSRGLKFTFRLRPSDLDANGDVVSDIYFGDDGALRSRRFDELLQYGDIIADELARRTPPPPPTPSAIVPTMPQPQPQGATGASTRQYSPPAQAAPVCPGCGWDVRRAQKKWGVDLECTNPQHLNDKGFPFRVGRA